MAQALLDFSQPLDVNLLDQTVAEFYGAASAEQVHMFNLQDPVTGVVTIEQLLWDQDGVAQDM